MSRRRRLPVRKDVTALAVKPPSSDLRYLEQVVTIQFPMASARTFLQRNMANKVTYRLVEALRGETVGCVRAVEVFHTGTGERTLIQGRRMLPNGQPASTFVPGHMVQIEAEVLGAARDSRNLSADDEIVLHVPVRGYMRFLPSIFQGEGPVHARQLERPQDPALQRYRGGELPPRMGTDVEVDADPMRRFLFLFQHVMTTLTEQIEQLPDLTHPLQADPRFLPWLASWVGFDLDGSLPVHQQRELVRRAIRLMRTRGTRAGIEEMVRVLTSAPVRVEERRAPRQAVLGHGATLVGGTDVTQRYTRSEPSAVYLMSQRPRKPTSYFTLRLEPHERFAQRFGERAVQVLRRIVKVVSAERPTHIHFVIRFDDSLR
ncbi:MAG: hypothetical protein KTR31_08835 [Myxococcales bacterium]|nr:hypothetical protein [Myxococcales bacterium]